MTRDPVSAITHSVYVYTGDDPLNGVDPTGLSWWNPTSWSGQTWVTIGGITLGVAAAATGVGAIVEGATLAGIGLGIGSVILGTGAAALDYSPCVNDGNAAACTGLGLGASGAFAGATGLGGIVAITTGVIVEDSLAAGIIGGIGAFGWQVGVAGTAVDLAAIFGASCPSEK